MLKKDSGIKANQRVEDIPRVRQFAKRTRKRRSERKMRFWRGELVGRQRSVLNRVRICADVDVTSLAAVCPKIGAVEVLETRRRNIAEIVERMCASLGVSRIFRYSL